MSTTPPTYKWNAGGDQVEHEGEMLDESAKYRSRTRISQRITGLCGSCSHSMIYRSVRDNEATVMCFSFTPEKRMPVDIEECTKYSRVGQLDISTLARMATLIDPDDKREQAGFKVTIVGKT